MALTKITGQVINDSTGLVVGVTTVGGGLSATDGFFSGIVTAVGDASFSGNVSVGGTLTYEDVTNIDAVGLVTARNGIVVGSGITLSKDGDIFATGVTTATTFSGSGASLTNLNASNLASGTVPTARLGSGTASSSTFLAGDSTFKTVTGTTINTNADNRVITGSDTANTLNGESTLTHSSGVLSVNEPSLSTDGKIIVKGNDTDNHDIITAYANSSTRGSFAIRNGTGIAPSFLVGTRGGSETLGLMTNGTERLRIDTSGHSTISDGNLVIGTSGKGIDFSNTTGSNLTGSSATAHLLDDYEEGTWTPKIKRYESGTWVDATMTSDGTVGSAIYRKIGGVVHFQLYWSGWQQSNSNYAVLGGLPYTSVGGGFAGVTYTDAFTTNPTQAGMISNGNSQIEFYVSSNQWNQFSTSSSRNLYVSGTYLTA